MEFLMANWMWIVLGLVLIFIALMAFKNRNLDYELSAVRKMFGKEYSKKITFVGKKFSNGDDTFYVYPDKRGLRAHLFTDGQKYKNKTVVAAKDFKALLTQIKAE